MVSLRPTWTFTGLPSIESAGLPPQYQPSEPVENSLTSAMRGTPLMTMGSDVAFWRKVSRLIGHAGCVATDIRTPPGRVGLALRVRGVKDVGAWVVSGAALAKKVAQRTQLAIGPALLGCQDVALVPAFTEPGDEPVPLNARNL